MHKKLNKILQEPDCPFVSLKLKITLFYLLSFVFIRCTTHCCHSLSLLPSSVTLCHSFPLVVIRCHSLYHSLSFVVSLVVIRRHSMYESSIFL